MECDRVKTFLLQSLGPSLTSTLNCLDKYERFYPDFASNAKHDALFVGFHCNMLTVIQAAYSTDILDKHCWSVKSFKHY